MAGGTVAERAGFLNRRPDQSSIISTPESRSSKALVTMVATGVEIAIGSALVSWFVPPNIKELMDSARKLAETRYKWYTGLQDKLEELAQHLEEINGIVGDAAAIPGFVRG